MKKHLIIGIALETFWGGVAAADKLQAELATRAGVDTVAPFGASLHVSGRDGAALEAAIASYQTRPGLHWQRSSASLEDVFIALMAEARDNFE